MFAVGRVDDASDLRHPALDLWLALVAGDLVWQEGPSTPGLRERIAAALGLVAACSTGALFWAAVATRFDTLQVAELSARERMILALALAATAAAAVLATRYVRLLVGREGAAAAFWPRIAWRAAAFFVIPLAITVALPRGHALGAVPFGAMVGADCSLTLWALGTTPRPRVWLQRFAAGPIHFGVLGAMLAAALFVDETPATRMTVGLYVAMWVGLSAIVLTIMILDRLAGGVESQLAADRADAIAQERAHRAHWLHDDVLSEVRLASIRISSGAATPDQINAELLDLDHRLRLRQLDEAMRGGSAHVYEVLQPHLRRAQNLGVTLERVPSHEATRLVLAEQRARLLNRAVSLLVSNAINAGAARLSIDLDADPVGGGIELRVTDDAGGFDLDAVPEGRGLASLARALGPGALTRRDAAGGSTMVVRVGRRSDRSDESDGRDDAHRTGDRDDARHDHDDQRADQHARRRADQPRADQQGAMR